MFARVRYRSRAVRQEQVGRQNGADRSPSVLGRRLFATATGKPSVFITTKIPALAVEKIAASCTIKHHWNTDTPIPRETFVKNAKEVEGVLCVLSDKIDAPLLASSPQLKMVSTLSVGFDHIDVAECKKRNVQVGNTPGVLTDTTADLVLTLTLATARRLPEALMAARNGEWQTNWKPLWMCGTDVSNSTVGIIGMGRIGQAVARRLRGFGCNILYSGPRPKPELADPVNAKYVPFDELLATSDFVIPLCPLNANTRHLFNAETFGKMKKSAIFINASRGGVVNQEALVQALKTDKIAAAGLDVTDPEPLPLNHPLFSEDLKSKLVVLPHIGSASVATRTKMAIIAADNLINGVSGKPLVSSVW